ncbi:Metal-dependent hydrolase, endonuclease/exonuclease/phosphatase family [Pseudoxanthobacter soli DSM 19599]|uniref:Metal-dependent hydrolase, endonuclease/exonuclease/phosphatase family n=1 Tax=Pseudoxanthobacter soli DSM 19599 TaxID=1123029 RepID=A0A1M7ZQN2_9HYPH|nr:endonuclease/exonuclease/phosphatase family protein [Pseudoxanthobacter soli]SHO66956.1 Metal-dependent hydrolase, endonuclease/exonuclease/phosphatase family [Pseudoxanthobacter soli DSM 19599]
MKLATYNIQYGIGRDGAYDLARAVKTVATADVIALQEVERGFARTRRDDQPALIEALLPDRHVVYAPLFDRDASERLADGRVRNARRQFGVLTASRWPILSARAEILPKHDGGAFFNLTTGFLETIIAAPAGPLRLLNIHLGHLSEPERLDQIAALARRLAGAADDGGPWSGSDRDAHEWESPEPAPAPIATVLMGDFNTAPGEAAYAALAALVSPEGEAFVDAWTAAAGPGEPAVTYYTNPAQGAFEDSRIDHIFVPAWLGSRLAIRIDADADGSDHQPVFATIPALGRAANAAGDETPEI